MKSRRRSLLLRIAQVLLLLVLPGFPCFAKWQADNFMILFSFGWPADQAVGKLNEESARRIAADHYNTVTCAPAELDLVARNNLRCIVMGRSNGPPNWVGESVAPAIVRTLATNPAVAGFYVTDEPDNANTARGTTFVQLRDRIAAYREAAPAKLPWINKTSATGQFLSDYMSIIRPDILSFDLYRWWAQESDWWRGLEAHRSAALKADVPMYVWIEQNADYARNRGNLPPPADNAQKIRWSVYTSVAYGTKGVQWFVARFYDEVAAVNAELSALGPTLVGLTSRNVYHTSGVPREGRRLPDGNWYTTATPNILIGEFTAGKEPGVTYFLVANKSVEKASDVSFDLEQDIAGVKEVSKVDGSHIALPLSPQQGLTRVQLHLSAGDGRLIRVETVRPKPGQVDLHVR